ncbi:MAG: CGGC domain-containing protein [Bacteroidetes bacterium RIFOXYA12_FULL_35_11]|nr:MAG: CGGC domain-containing protein [Bacteroidetes bacterium GWF2_35_48]OFY72614.1 MAG: CGGC domain-containing protein [Bacteroidetes bacterium RIFOXYA12_FULL_35_11]OFY93361.1 MAG: CGGC domain-containing protein [Bacteroidetes bacterium RIFOXYC12_FULL_35_7]HBX52530.1 CGGC domain-containing protein [Bacteroidales bacterium]
MKKIKIGIIICNRYQNCAGGKCFRSFSNREGAFEIYKNKDAEIAAYTTCGGCPGGNVEYAPDEMKKNGVTHVHFATGLIVGYPPCPNMKYFEKYLTEKYSMTVIYGTHPIPQKYFITHSKLKTWNTDFMKKVIQNTLCNEQIRLNYD